MDVPSKQHLTAAPVVTAATAAGHTSEHQQIDTWNNLVVTSSLSSCSCCSNNRSCCHHLGKSVTDPASIRHTGHDPRSPVSAHVTTRGTNSWHATCSLPCNDRPMVLAAISAVSCAASLAVKPAANSVRRVMPNTVCQLILTTTYASTCTWMKLAMTDVAEFKSTEQLIGRPCNYPATVGWI